MRTTKDERTFTNKLPDQCRNLIDVSRTILARMDLEPKDAVFPASALRNNLRAAIEEATRSEIVDWINLGSVSELIEACRAALNKTNVMPPRQDDRGSFCRMDMDNIARISAALAGTIHWRS